MRDPAFPSLHIRPPTGWMNDPNGLSLIDGVYHVFYQFNGVAPRHEAITWGHASSTDLLHWHDHGVALVNRPGEVDEAGCWSGTITDDAGVPTAVYTAVRDHAARAGVVLARSDRTMLSWAQETAHVVGTPADPAISEARDPFVFVHDGHRYAVQGAGHPAGRPQILLYGCDDLASWTELGALITDDDPIAAEVAPANIWECPSLLPFGERWVLVLSLWRWRDETHELAGVRYLVGSLAPRPEGGLRFVAESGGSLDSGPTFYAPQALVLPDRTLLWGWAWEDGRTQDEVDAAGWAGVLTFPRELELRGSHLVANPAAELVGLRSQTLPVRAGEPFAAGTFEVVAEGAVTLTAIDGETRTVVAELVDVPAAAGDTRVRIFVDGSLVEVFGGPIPHTSRYYPTARTQWLVAGDSVTVYALALPAEPVGTEPTEARSTAV